MTWLMNTEGDYGPVELTSSVMAPASRDNSTAAVSMSAIGLIVHGRLEKQGRAVENCMLC